MRLIYGPGVLKIVLSLTLTCVYMLLCSLPTAPLSLNALDLWPTVSLSNCVYNCRVEPHHLVDFYAIGIVLSQNMFYKKVYMCHRVSVLFIFGTKIGKNVQNILFK